MVKPVTDTERPDSESDSDKRLGAQAHRDVNREDARWKFGRGLGFRLPWQPILWRRRPTRRHGPGRPSHGGISPASGLGFTVRVATERIACGEVVLCFSTWKRSSVVSGCWTCQTARAANPRRRVTDRVLSTLVLSIAIAPLHKLV